MNRRFFLYQCSLVFAGLTAGLWATGKKVSGKFLWYAKKIPFYPGRLRALEKPLLKSPWSG